jgi:integrase/recombinase XerD
LISETDSALLDRFCDALWLEDGLSRNTLEAYRRDLLQLASWLEPRGMGLAQVGGGDLQGYLAHLYAQRAKARTSSRRLSSFKRFCQFLVREGIAQADPTLNIESPKLPRSLPKSLTEADVDTLLATPDAETVLGLRDKAMLETLYASGLRVSELVTLTGRCGCRLHQALSGRRPFGPALRPRERCPVRHRSRRGHDAPGVLASDQALCG